MDLDWSQLCCLVIIIIIFAAVSSFFLGGNDNHIIDNYTIPNDAVIVSCSNSYDVIDNSNHTVTVQYFGKDTDRVVDSYESGDSIITKVVPGSTVPQEYYKIHITFYLEDMKINGSNNYPISPDSVINDLFTNNTYEFNESSADLKNIEDIILIFYDNDGNVIDTINLTESNVTFSIDETIHGLEYYKIYIITKVYDDQEISKSYGFDIEECRENGYGVGNAELHIILHNGTNYYYDLVFPLKVTIMFGRELQI